MKIIPDFLKKRIPTKMKANIRYLLSKQDYTASYNKEDLKMFVTLAADYANLGDLAITKAQIKFLKDYFPQYEVIEYKLSDTYKGIHKLKKLCNPTDVITIIGGGNMGDLYEGIEECRRTIIEFFPNNKIISFPQTIDFSKDHNGIISLEKSIKIYSRHKDLHIFARENNSYDLMKKFFHANKVYLAPDIVLYLNEKEPRYNRSGVILCLRDDKETKVSALAKHNLIEIVKKKYDEIAYYDTHIGEENFQNRNVEFELEKIWSTFKKSELVVTDRLHGMIFCAITSTPCIVFPNSNHKITSTYTTWLRELSFIQLIDESDIPDINFIISKLLQNNFVALQAQDFSGCYQELVKTIQSL